MSIGSGDNTPDPIATSVAPNQQASQPRVCQREFHSAITGRPCSVESLLTVPVASWNSRPSAGGSPRRRAVSTRRKCPCATRITSPGLPSAASTRARTRSARRPDLVGRLAGVPGRAGRHPVRPQDPAGPGAVDLVGRDALVAAVVPLVQVRVDPRPGHAREFGGADRAGERAGEDAGEGPSGEERGEGPRLFLAVRGEGQVGPAGVLSRRAPLGLAVADQEKVTHGLATPSPTRRRGRRTGCAAPRSSSSAASRPAGTRTARRGTP